MVLRRPVCSGYYIDIMQHAQEQRGLVALHKRECFNFSNSHLFWQPRVSDYTDA
jgi:hypothetical protein